MTENTNLPVNGTPTVPEYLSRLNEWAQDSNATLDLGGLMVPQRVTALVHKAQTCEHYADVARKGQQEVQRIRGVVRAWVAEQVENGDLERDEANSLLGSIGADLLARQFTATITIEVEVSFQSTADDSEIEGALDDLNVDVDTYSSDLEDFDVDSSRVTNVAFEEE